MITIMILFLQGRFMVFYPHQKHKEMKQVRQERKHKEMKQVKQKSYWPFLTKHPRSPGRHMVVILRLTLEGLIVWKFEFPTIDNVLETCRKNSTRGQNSFIIFRNFLSRSRRSDHTYPRRI